MLKACDEGMRIGQLARTRHVIGTGNFGRCQTRLAAAATAAAAAAASAGASAVGQSIAYVVVQRAREQSRLLAYERHRAVQPRRIEQCDGNIVLCRERGQRVHAHVRTRGISKWSSTARRVSMANVAATLLQGCSMASRLAARK